MYRQSYVELAYFSFINLSNNIEVKSILLYTSHIFKILNTAKENKCSIREYTKGQRLSGQTCRAVEEDDEGRKRGVKSALCETDPTWPPLGPYHGSDVQIIL